MHQAVLTIFESVPKRWQQLIKQFIKFGITGVIGAIVDFSTYFFITRVLHFTNYYVAFGQKIIVANNISVFLAIISNFFLNKYWTFRDQSAQVVRQGASYFLFNTGTWVLNQFLVSIFAFQIPAFSQLFGSLKDVAAKVLAIGIILFINFAGGKLIFRKNSRAS